MGLVEIGRDLSYLLIQKVQLLFNQSIIIFSLSKLPPKKAYVLINLFLTWCICHTRISLSREILKLFPLKVCNLFVLVYWFIYLFKKLTSYSIHQLLYYQFQIYRQETPMCLLLYCWIYTLLYFWIYIKMLPEIHGDNNGFTLYVACR